MAVVSTQPTKVALFYDLPTMWVYFFAILWFWPDTPTTHRHFRELREFREFKEFKDAFA